MRFEVLSCLLLFTAAESGTRLQIDLIKPHTSELSRTVLWEPSVASFNGEASDLTGAGVSGELVPFFPLDGCQPLVHDPSLTEANADGSLRFKSYANSTAFVVLMQRGRCDYATMFQNAAKVENIAAVLIYDPVNGGQYSNSLKIQGTQMQLPPGLLISNALGDDLRKKVMKYRESTRDNKELAPWVKVQLNYVESPFSFDMFSTILLWFGLVLIGCLVMAALYVVCGFFRRSDDDNSNLTIPPSRKPEEIVIDDEFLAKLPKKAYRSPNSSPVDYEGPIKAEEMAHDEGDYRKHMPHNESCPVCLEDFVYGTEVNQLHCGHCYHPRCILPWLKDRSPLCPLCQIDVRILMIEAEELEFVRNLRRSRHSKNGSAKPTSPREMEEAAVISKPQ